MEKAYKTMKSAGAGSVALGIIMIVAGTAAGIITVINGVRLLRHKNDITF